MNSLLRNARIQLTTGIIAVIAVGAVWLGHVTQIAKAAASVDPVFELPEGYCEFSINNRLDALLFSRMRLVENASNMYIHKLFTTCTQLHAWRDGVKVNTSGSIAESVQEAEYIRKFPKEFMAALKNQSYREEPPDLETAVKKVRSVGGTVNLGIIHQDEFAVYRGSLEKAQDGQNTTTLEVHVHAYTVIDDRAFALSLRRPYENKETIDAMVEMFKRMIALEHTVEDRKL